MKLYFLKYDIEAGEIILDKSRRRASIRELLIVPYKVSTRQGERLSERIGVDRLKRGRILFSHEVEYIFNRMFNVCKECGFVTDKVKSRKQWNGLCRSCFREYQEAQKIEFRDKRDYRRQIRKYKLHLNTLQGQIDSVPLELIEANVRLELKKQGKTVKSLSDGIKLRQSKINEMFKGKTIKKEYLLEISEYLFVPVEKLLRIPRGASIPYKDGVPKFWLDDGFVIRNYNDELKRKFS